MLNQFAHIGTLMNIIGISENWTRTTSPMCVTYRWGGGGSERLHRLGAYLSHNAKV